MLIPLSSHRSACSQIPLSASGRTRGGMRDSIHFDLLRQRRWMFHRSSAISGLVLIVAC
jgi:hypothetical protein